MLAGTEAWRLKLEDVLHTDEIGLEAQVLVEAFCLRIAGPDMERHAVAALLFRVGTDCLPEMLSHMLAAAALVHAEVVEVELAVLAHVGGAGQILELAEGMAQKLMGAFLPVFVHRDEDGMCRVLDKCLELIFRILPRIRDEEIGTSFCMDTWQKRAKAQEQLSS